MRQFPFASSLDEWVGSEFSTRDWEYKNRRAH